MKKLLMLLQFNILFIITYYFFRLAQYMDLSRMECLLFYSLYRLSLRLVFFAYKKSYCAIKL